MPNGQRAHGQSELSGIDDKDGLRHWNSDSTSNCYLAALSRNFIRSVIPLCT